MFYSGFTCFTKKTKAKQSIITVTNVILLHHQNKDGTYPVKFRITKDRLSVYFKSPFYAESSQVNSKGEIKDRIKIQRYIIANHARLYLLSVRSIAAELAQHLYGVQADD